MRYTRHALAELNRKYRSVLIKCALMNIMVFALGVPNVRAADLNWTTGPKNVTAEENYDSVAISGGTVTLTGTGAINSAGDFEISDAAVVNVNGTNTLTAGEAVLMSGGTLNITGTLNTALAIDGGTLTFGENGVLNGMVYSYNALPWADVQDDLQKINGAFVDLVYDEVWVPRNMYISGGEADYDMSAYGDIIITGGTFTADGEINFEANTLTVSGGTFNANDADEENNFRATTTMTVSGGTFNANGEDGENNFEANALTVSGGTFNAENGNNYFSSTGTLKIDDGTFDAENGYNSFFSTGNMTVEGGEFTAIDNSLFSDEQNLTISGGTFVANDDGENDFGATQDLTVSGDTLSVSGYRNSLSADNDVTVSGGEFIASSIEGENNRAYNKISADGDVTIK